MSAQGNVEVMRKIFEMIEQRDTAKGLIGRIAAMTRAAQYVHFDVEFHWPPALPYGGVSRGLKPTGRTWGGTWDPLQPTEAERRMDHRVVAASEGEVVVLWRQRGVSPAGDRIDTPVLGLYGIQAGKLARAQMFYFDTAAVLSFLAKAGT